MSSNGSTNVLSSLRASRRRTALLSNALDKMDTTTAEAYRCCDLLTRRARQLDSLTSPASDASSTLSRANANLAATLVLMKDAREKFDTVQDCEPAIERLDKGVQDMQERDNSKEDLLDLKNSKNKSRKNIHKKPSSLKNRVVLSEQDVYAAGDSIEILRDAYDYFIQNGASWRSAPSSLSGLERLHTTGTEAMCLLIKTHLKKAGQAVRPKRSLKKTEAPPAEETAHQVSLNLFVMDPVCRPVLSQFCSLIPTTLSRRRTTLDSKPLGRSLDEPRFAQINWRI